jgi:hypothetical protein
MIIVAIRVLSKKTDSRADFLKSFSSNMLLVKALSGQVVPRRDFERISNAITLRNQQAPQ